MGNQIAFIVIAAVTIIAAACVVIIPNILRSALFLAFSFLGVAALYILLNAEFLAAMQVLIYVGAITVLIMFAIVLTQQLMGAKIKQSSRAWWIGAPVAVLAFLLFTTSFVTPFKHPTSGTAVSIASAPAVPKDFYAENEQARASEGTTPKIAEMLLRPYVLPFELASLILLAALVGAIVIAKEENE